jgi:hypothetical protein
LPAKVPTATFLAKKSYDESFIKHTVLIHPTIIPFLTAVDINDTSLDISDMDDDYDANDDVHLQPIIAPVNHNTLTSLKAVHIVHTLMGNSCHGDKDKTSQMKDMGNDACLLMGFHDKVRLEWYTSNFS